MNNMHMEYEIFRDELIETLKERFAEKGVFEIAQSQNEKLQFEGHDMFCIRPEGSNLGVSLDTTILYRSYIDGESFDEICEKAETWTLDGLNHQPSFNLNELTNYDSVKERLLFEVIPTERNAELLRDVPHREVKDLSVVCRISVDFGDGEGTVLVKNSLLEEFGISEEQLFADTEKCAQKNRPVNILNILEILAEMRGVDKETLLMMCPGATDVPMYVATTPNRIFGAGLLAYPDFYKKAAELFEGSFYILPSSIHERATRFAA